MGHDRELPGRAFVPGDARRARLGHRRPRARRRSLRIVDDDGPELAAGEEGNFEVHTDCLFEGYLNRPELTAEAVTADGWYRTGDLATDRRRRATCGSPAASRT